MKSIVMDAQSLILFGIALENAEIIFLNTPFLNDDIRSIYIQLKKDCKRFFYPLKMRIPHDYREG